MEDKVYQLSEPIYTEAGQYANAVLVNQQGEWLAEAGPMSVTLYTEAGQEYEGFEESVTPLCDEGGDYIPAPSDWRELVK